MPFKSNLVKASLIRPAFGSTLAELVYAWVILLIAPLLIIKFALAIIWIIGFDWVWVLQPRFENSPGRTMLNFLYLRCVQSGQEPGSGGHGPGLSGSCDGLLDLSASGALLILVILGYGITIMLHTPF